MAHARLQLRDAVAAALRAMPSLADCAFTNRVDPLQESELPCILVMVTDETLSVVAMGGLLQRDMVFTVEIVAKLDATFDDTLEALATTVEQALGVATALPGFKAWNLASVSKGRPNGEGQSDLMLLRMTYGAIAHTLEEDPETLK